jgi:hypothetical protein
MPIQDEHDHYNDRRIEGRVRELENKVQVLETSDALRQIKFAYLEGEVDGLRSSSASSADLLAATKLIDVRFDMLSKEVGGIKSIGWTFIVVIVVGFIGAIASQVYK